MEQADSANTMRASTSEKKIPDKPYEHVFPQHFRYFEDIINVGLV